jgi:hypothetical protein
LRAKPEQLHVKSGHVGHYASIYRFKVSEGVLDCCLRSHRC